MQTKKIGILTYIREYSNIGTNMQSYCTLKALERTYPDTQVELADYALSRPKRKPYFSNASWHSLKNDLVRMKKYEKFFREHQRFSRSRLVSSQVDKAVEFLKAQDYDAIYVGSDTVLELKGAGPDNLNAYWLDRTIACKKFLIAASSLNVVYESLTERQRDKMRESIEGFSLLGVRDDATFRLLSHVTSSGDARLRLIPDPTFTYEIDYSPIERYIEKRKLSFDKPMVCLHLTRDIKWGPEVADHFRREGFVVASLRPAHYADIIFTDLSPFEQMGIYRYFRLVITHRFHDSIFCLKNHTPVIVFPEYVADVTKYGENKNLTLLKSFNLEKANYIENKDHISGRHLIEIYQDAINNFKINEEYIGTTLKKHKEKYESFVKESRRMCLE